MGPPSDSARPAFRDATEADLPAIVGIYNSTIPSRMVTADTEAVTVASRAEWFKAHDPKRRPIWVVDASNGGLCAWLAFSAFHARPAYSATAEIGVYVDGAHRRHGWGRYLIGQAVGRAHEYGIRTLVGLIFGHNEPSLRLFERFGFERWAFLPGVATLDGVDRNLVIVGRRVPAPKSS